MVLLLLRQVYNISIVPMLPTFGGTAVRRISAARADR